MRKQNRTNWIFVVAGAAILAVFLYLLPPAYDHHEVLWQYPKITMTWMSSLTNSYGFDLHGEPRPERRLGIYFHGANGTMYANYGIYKIVPEGDKMKNCVEPPKSIPPSPGTNGSGLTASSHDNHRAAIPTTMSGLMCRWS